MPRAPDPYEYRGEARIPTEVQRVWRKRGFEQMSMFVGNTLEIAMPAPAQRHSPTSKAAAALMDHGTGTLLRQQIYTLLLGLLPDGLTDEEGQDMLHMAGNTYRPRRVELEEVGLVRDSKTTRLTKAKRKAVVWVAVPMELLGEKGANDQATEPAQGDRGSEPSSS